MLFQKSDAIMKKVIEKTEERILEAKNILDNKGIKRKLHIISLSDDLASKSYMNNKIKEGERYGIEVLLHKPKDIKELDMIIEDIKSDENNRVIIQKPYDEEKWGKTNILLSKIPKYMDVDGFTTTIMDINYIKTYEELINLSTYSPTAKGVISIIHEIYNGNMKSYEIMVIGKGLTSGMPIALGLEQLGSTIIWCNSSTDKEKLKYKYPLESEVVISCAGKKDIISPVDIIGKNSKLETLINVGMSRGEDGKLKADLDINKFNNRDLALKFCNKLIGTTGKLTTMNLILNVLL